MYGRYRDNGKSKKGIFVTAKKNTSRCYLVGTFQTIIIHLFDLNLRRRHEKVFLFLLVR